VVHGQVEEVYHSTFDSSGTPLGNHL